MEKIIYMFWTGDNKLTPNRIKSLEQFKNTCGVKIILITKDNLNEYILKDVPLHPAYKYLHYTHKADYLRTYFMNFYGGGYSDIKPTTGSWDKCFDELKNNNDKWGIGFKERGEFDIAYHPAKKYWRELIGNAGYIFKPHTEFTQNWYDEMIKVMDKKLDLLIECGESKSVNGSDVKNYPIEWNEMLGRIFHKYCLKYKDKLINTLPLYILNNYK